MFKSRLQELCQKQQWDLPEYEIENEGPGHDLRFRSTVTVNGRSFAGPSGFRSVKEAQSEAARLAILGLFADDAPTNLPFSPQLSPSLFALQQNASSPTDVSDVFLYKSKLQELCHKKKLSPLPKYDTTKDGPDHRPLFRTTVHVGGLLFGGPDGCSSSKEAQDKAAKIAFTYFSRADDTPLPVAASGSPQADSEGSVNNGPRHRSRDVKVAPDNSMDFGGQCAGQVESLNNGFSCKNRLQNYAQKRKLGLPSYDYVQEGSIPNCRYRAKVMVGCQIFENEQFFSSLKEAENAAAKVALASLFAEGDQEDDPIFYKNLLSELIQKMSLSPAIYETFCEGPPHMPLFFTSVEVEGEKFNGKAAKTKKQAEQHAAGVAWAALQERNGKSAPKFKEYKDNGVSLQKASAVGDLLQKPPAPLMRDISADVLDCSEIKALTSQIVEETTPPAKSLDLSQSTTCSFPMEEDHTPDQKTDWKGESDPSVFDHPTSLTGIKHSQPCKKIQVYPRRPNIELPEGARRLLICDDKWIAVQVESSCD